MHWLVDIGEEGISVHKFCDVSYTLTFPILVETIHHSVSSTHVDDGISILCKKKAKDPTDLVCNLAHTLT